MKMRKTQSALQYSLAILCFLLLAACTGSNQIVLGQAQTEWDFDHQLQYKKTQLSVNIYQLEIVSNHKANFERLSAFLLRQSYLICGGYGYKLELLRGVERFDHLRESPNLIIPNLTAKLQCPIDN